MGVLLYNNNCLIFSIKIPINYTKHDEDKNLKDLVLSKNCIFKGNCKLIFNYNTSFELFDDEIIIIKNARNTKINNSCNQNTSNLLNGNNILMFSNCKISIQNEKFSNQKENYFEKIPDYETYNNKTFTNKITFNDIILSNTKNIEMIEELTQHQHILFPNCGRICSDGNRYDSNNLCIQKKSINIKVKEKIQENSSTRGEELRIRTPPISTPLQTSTT